MTPDQHRAERAYIDALLASALERDTGRHHVRGRTEHRTVTMSRRSVGVFRVNVPAVRHV